MSESSKVKAWAAKNGTTIESYQRDEGATEFVIKLSAPAGKCFTTNDEHAVVVRSATAKTAWKEALSVTRQGIEDCPVVCNCRNERRLNTPESPDEAVPPLQTENAVVVAPTPENPAYPTREGYLMALTERIKPLISEAGGNVPSTVRVACGWPSKRALSSKNRRLGECWKPAASADHHTEIFVSPVLSTGLDAAECLAHELIHADPSTKGHGAAFKRIAVALGLEGKMTATVAGEGLKQRLNEIVAELGAYPHATLDLTQSPVKKDGTRLLKVVCPDEECGYTIRTTQKWIEIGLPTCPCGTLMAQAE